MSIGATPMSVDTTPMSIEGAPASRGGAPASQGDAVASCDGPGSGIVATASPDPIAAPSGRAGGEGAAVASAPDVPRTSSGSHAVVRSDASAHAIGVNRFMPEVISNHRARRSGSSRGSIAAP